MQDDPEPSAPGLDAPLPIELAGQGQGWFTRYRRYPVFSARWARERTLAWLLPVGLVLLFIAGGALLGSPGRPPWAAVLGISSSLLLPLLVGPWLGVWVRRRRWAVRREGWALLVVMLLLVAAMLTLERFAAEPVKQWIAERIGDVDASGRRNRIALQIGVMVEPVVRGDAPASAAMAEKPPADPTSPLNLAVRGVIAFWFGGGFALLAWRREHEALAALASRRALSEAQAKRREAELRLSVLAAQVEPHFLFNTLAGVRSAIASDPARAAEMIDRLVDYLRAAIPRLRSDGAAQASVGGQLDIVRAYLGLMAARMPRLQFSVTAPPELLSAHCPPLMLISLAENAVKHGVEMKIGPARVDVRAERTADGRLALTVEDDGVGFSDSASGSGIGLSNIRERLAQLYGERAALALKARPQGGVAATITVPLEDTA
jgi:two-component sensor histidine kinase